MGSIRKKGEGQFEARVKRSKPIAVSMSKSFKTERAAREWINEVEHKLDVGQPVSRRAESILFSEACAEFLENYRPRHGETVSDTDRQLVTAVNHHLGSFTITALTHDRIQRFVDMLSTTPIPTQERKKLHRYYNGGRVRTYSPSTVRKHYFAIKKVVEWHSARAQYPIDGALFRNHIIPGAWKGKRSRRLEEGELERILAAVPGGKEHKEAWPLLIGFALVTAARAQEILMAKWSDINEKTRVWNIPADNSKTGSSRQIPLGKRALEIVAQMRELRRDEEPRVFWQWSNSNTLSKAWRRLCHRAKVEGLVFHDLRHEGVSRLFEKTTLSDAEIMSITGHTSAKILLGYAHLRPTYLADKMDALD